MLYLKYTLITVDCEDSILHCKEVLVIKQEEKPVMIEKLAANLQRDIKILLSEVEEVRKEIVKDWLIDANANPADVKETLVNLMDRLVLCQSQSKEYRKYQKEFRTDVTRFDKIESVLQEIKMKQMLWDSNEEWEKSLEAWHRQSFNTIDVDELTNSNLKILKNCTVLEKNLPKNKILPKLKNSAEEFKEKLPVIGYLRNPALKTRHWLQIESIINRKLFQDETITLNLYENAGAFTSQIAEQIMEISGQASAELSLEMLLKKVENSWKELELSVVSHREAKDVFILAGLDELQLVLDESNISINTLAASRNVGPIKSRVDEWQRLLDLFALTLGYYIFFLNTLKYIFSFYKLSEEWITCQTSWIYLEAIFSAPDIQRQLPIESRMFLIVDKNWKELMRKVYKQPLALPAMTDPHTFEMMKENNQLLDKITKCLEAYLEVKRVAFPRFYFLSNDELLEILAQTRNPHAVQPHLRKCFDAIAKLEFGTKEGGEDGGTMLTTDIIALISPEGERILLGIVRSFFFVY